MMPPPSDREGPKLGRRRIIGLERRVEPDAHMTTQPSSRRMRLALGAATVAAIVVPGTAHADTVVDPTGTACVATNGSSAGCTALAVGVFGGHAYARGVGICPPGMTHANGNPYCVRSQWTSTADGAGAAVSDSGSATGPVAASGTGPASATCWRLEICHVSGVAVSGTGDAAADGGTVISGTGSATNSGSRGLGSAISGTGSAQSGDQKNGAIAFAGGGSATGGWVSVAPNGPADGSLAVSVLGSSTGFTALTVVGDASGSTAVTAMGDAHTGWRGTAVSLFGNAYGYTDEWGNRPYVTVSGTGDAYGGLISVAPLGHAG